MHVIVHDPKAKRSRGWVDLPVLPPSPKVRVSSDLNWFDLRIKFPERDDRAIAWLLDHVPSHYLHADACGLHWMVLSPCSYEVKRFLMTYLGNESIEVIPYGTPLYEDFCEVHRRSMLMPISDVTIPKHDLPRPRLIALATATGSAAPSRTDSRLATLPGKMADRCH